MENLGYFYEARKNKYQGLKARKYRVDAERAAQDYYSAKFESPALAKDKKVLLYGSLYEDIFNEKINVEEYLASFLLHDNIIRWNKNEKIRKEYTFIRDSALHSVALLFNKFGIKFSDFSEGELGGSYIKNYTKVLDATKKVVDERYKKEGDKYEHRKTFKDPETYGRIVENLR